MQATTGLEDGLKRDVAILSTLAHLHCVWDRSASSCIMFSPSCSGNGPNELALFGGGWICGTKYLANEACEPGTRQDISRERGQIWILTPKGHDLLQQHILDAPPIGLDRSRPTEYSHRT